MKTTNLMSEIEAARDEAKFNRMKANTAKMKGQKAMFQIFTAQAMAADALANKLASQLQQDSRIIAIS
jgi:hypothetical protein